MQLFLNIVQCKRKSEIQDGGTQIEELLISQLVYNVAAQF